MTNEDTQREWARTTYLGHLASLLDSNLTYLHSTLTWAITLLLGGVGVVVARPTFPDRTGVIALLVLAVVVGHFAVRTAKAYLNVMRWSSLEKRIIRGFLTTVEEITWESDRDKILQYHCSWESPLGFGAVAYKVLFELGFAYFWGIALGLLFYSLTVVPVTRDIVGAILGALIVLVVEVWLGLLRSAYLRRVRVDGLAAEQR